MRRFCISVAPKLHYAFPAGERYRLVQTTQEHRSADDVQRKARPREAEELPVQSSHDLSAANAQQHNTSRLNPQDGVCRLHLTQQVGVLYINVFFFFLFFLQCETIMLLHITASQNFTFWIRINITDPESIVGMLFPLVTNLWRYQKWKLYVFNTICMFSYNSTFWFVCFHVLHADGSPTFLYWSIT